MTHLRIELNTSPEEVSSSVILKLYEIVYAGLDSSSNLLGWLYCPITYRSYVLYLTTLYPDLHINVNDYAIPFEDLNMVTYLNSLGVGSNGMITENQAAATTIVANSTNTTITKFNELRYFTGITESRDGWTGGSSGYTRFAGWTALEEVDISNFTSLGHAGGYGNEDTFNNCTSLKTVTASSKLTKIGTLGFRLCSNLETITGLDGIIEVSTLAFLNCDKLSSSCFLNVAFKFAVNNGIRYGDYAFEHCLALTTLHFDKNSTSYIPPYCFRNSTSLLTVTGLAPTVEIAGWGFNGCTSLTGIGNTVVTKMGNSVFNGCTSLTSISIALDSDSDSNMQSQFNGCRSLTNVTCDWTNAHVVRSYMFYGCTSLLTIDLTGVTEIKERAFGACSALSSLTGISDVAIISGKAFEACTALTSLVFGGNVTTIYGEAFTGCYNLTSVTGLSNLLSISGDSCFSGCKKLTTIDIDWSNVANHTIPRFCFDTCESLQSYDITGATNIKDRAFGHCKELTSVTGCSNVTEIRNNAFFDCLKLLSIDDVSNVSGTIGPSAFEGCYKLKRLNLSNKVTFLDDDCFWNCQELEDVGDVSNVTLCIDGTFYKCTKLTSLNFSNKLTSIGGRSFLDCSSLTSLGDLSGLTGAIGGAFCGCSSMTDYSTLANSSITYVGNAFENNTSLVTITLPSTLLECGANVFYNCSALQSVYFTSLTPPTIHSKTFLETPNTMNIYVPSASLNDYKTAPNWSNYASRIFAIPT